MNKNFYIVCIVVSILSLSYAAAPKKRTTTQEPKVVKSTETIQSFVPRIFKLDENVISNNQFQQHYQLYVGYVNKRNSIKQDLISANRSNQNPTYSIFRGLKIAETFARNAALLHELYFENIKSNTKMGKLTKLFLEYNFGSIAAFKEDLLACALCARGWALTCYNLDDHTIQNYVLDAHNQTVPILSIPLIVIDVYEHAYMIDYGIDRKQYLDLLWSNINWDIVEERVEQWVKQ